MIGGCTFDELLGDVHARSDRMLPDVVVHVSDLRMTPVGHLQAPGTPTLRPNPWGLSQLASMLGVRWKAWFSSAIQREERADEINRRLSRMPGEMKIRAWQDPMGEAGALRAPSFLRPSRPSSIAVCGIASAPR